MKRLWPFVLVLAMGLSAAVRDGVDRWIARTRLPLLLHETGTELRGADNSLLRAYPVENGIRRLAVTPETVDPAFLSMLLQIEDRRFARHGGVDPRAILRAGLQAAQQGRVVSGASTLTMQVARLLENGGTGQWRGKLRQMRVAMALERRLSKRQILGLYLLHAPYGSNIEGIRAATLAWFGKEPARLTPAQAALLIALPQAPEARRPDLAPDAAHIARARVLTRLQSAGLLDSAAAETARRAPLPDRLRPFPRLAPHVGDRLRNARPHSPVLRTAIMPGPQAALETLAAEALQGQPNGLSAAILAVDHQSGEIVASVGSGGYGPAGAGFVDMTHALRSPGSTLKPLIYGMAFAAGLGHPETLIADAPVQFGRYAPQNFDGRFRGDVRMREALAMSLNTPVVRLAAELGPARVWSALRRAGMTPQLGGGGAPGLAVALGGVGVTLHDLVQLYAVLAQGGQGRHLRIDGPGAQLPRLLPKVAAWQVGNILAGIPPPAGAPTAGIAYKTGTSYGHRDAWAIGWDGAHVIGVWMGRPDGTPVPGAFGGDLAAPVLFAAFQRLKPGFAPLPPPPAATLLVGNATLPPPLRRFRERGAAFDRDARAPRLSFPPDGARLLRGGALTLKLRGGRPPFAVLVQGRPVITGARGPHIEIPRPGPGYSEVVVLDSDGRSGRAGITIE